MKKILIISPHYPPSNLAAVHRARLIAQHLPALGWEPIILTVNESFYEETLDLNLKKLIPKNQRVEKVSAYRITKPRIIGDIGLRAFFQLRKKALEIVQNEDIDFVYLPIPSFYISLIGPYLYRKSGVLYGIDYIDPWVHVFPGSNQFFSRHWFSTKLAVLLEPLAVKKASLITGVAEGYYRGVFERNPQLAKTCYSLAMPYGGERQDHDTLVSCAISPYLFAKNGKIQLVYAGAMLPKAYLVLEAIFQSIVSNQRLFSNIEIHFIGTGKTVNDPSGFTIKPIAEKYGIWHRNIFEYPQRIPYLDVLIHLNAADAVFILGSTEPHYTPSKTYQAVLAGKPILAFLHEESTAVDILIKSKAGIVLTFGSLDFDYKIKSDFSRLINEFLSFQVGFSIKQVDMHYFDKYSAKEVTKQLVNKLNQIV